MLSRNFQFYLAIGLALCSVANATIVVDAFSLEGGFPTPHGEYIKEAWGIFTKHGYDKMEKYNLNQKHSVAIVRLGPGKSSIFHRHPKIEESYAVLSGEGTVYLHRDHAGYRPFKTKTQIYSGDLVVIPVKTEHLVVNHGLEDLVLSVVAADPWNPTCMEDLEKEKYGTEEFARKRAEILDFFHDAAEGSVLNSRNARAEEPVKGLIVRELWGLNQKQTYFTDTPQHSVTHVTFSPGFKETAHFHLKSEETFLVLKGVATIHVQNPETGEIESAEVAEGNLVPIPVGLIHFVENNTSEEMVILAATAEPWTLEDVHSAPSR